MRIILLLLSSLALAKALSLSCRSTLPVMEVCAYAGCYLNIAQNMMEILNCDRDLRGLQPLQFYSEGKCGPLVQPKCKVFDF